ncbi:MAG: M1 family metallopeptidase, partial [Bacteroidota bacterium]
MKESDYGYTNVKSIKILANGYYPETDITSTVKYIQPDDNNKDDQTVFQVTAPKPVRDGQSITFRLEFETKQPIPISRTGAIRNYHFVAQWFPKIGVWWNPARPSGLGGGAWNCHQFHRTTEFFADYGVYDVSITVPATYVVGATGGEPRSTKDNGDGTKTLNFYQEDVHDFAWTACPEFIRIARKFSHTAVEPEENPRYHHPLKEVGVILLLQPHHRNKEERYFNATFKALQYYGEWYGEYPYDYVTVVDPANDSRSGGMEYPTLFTGGTNYFSPHENASPEGVTVHEFGHQFWYGLVGNNEFEEAWLDEGFNTYSTDKVLNTAWKPFQASRYFFGGSGAGSFVGVPVVLKEVKVGRMFGGNTQFRYTGKNDVMARKGWEYYNSSGLNAYTKPALSLYTLERFLGEDLMYRVMRTYHHRYRFKHPTSKDFINTVNEVVGRDMTWFFDQTWYSSNLFDYSIDYVSSRTKQAGKGIFNFNGQSSSDSSASVVAATGDSIYVSEVVVKREGEAT